MFAQSYSLSCICLVHISPKANRYNSSIFIHLINSKSNWICFPFFFSKTFSHSDMVNNTKGIFWIDLFKIKTCVSPAAASSAYFFFNKLKCIYCVCVWRVNIIFVILYFIAFDFAHRSTLSRVSMNVKMVQDLVYGSNHTMTSSNVYILLVYFWTKIAHFCSQAVGTFAFLDIKEKRKDEKILMYYVVFLRRVFWVKFSGEFWT